MGQDVPNSESVTEPLADPAPQGRGSKPVKHSYDRELLLSFSDLDICKKRPENLDPVVWRDAPAADGAEGGIGIPAIGSRGLVRRDREGEAFSKSPVDIPEWRKDSWRSGGSGASLPQGPRRKPYDEEPLGSAFSTSYPPRPAANWGENGHLRSSYERPGLQGQGSGRWEHRAGLGDREREQGRPLQKWDSEEIGAVPVPVDGPRSFGGGSPLVRPGWIPAERDGLLGSGGGLHRTYTGNFTTPSAFRLGPERQLSMGPPERQNSMGSMGPPERQNSMGRLVMRNSEAYQASRSLKGPGFARREDTDFVNDETFGLEGSSTDDRAEQERKRRESFELMRKDHHRLLQKQQKLLTQKQEERLAHPESNANRKHDESTLWDSTLSSDRISSTPPRSPEKHSTDTDEVVSSTGISAPIVAPSTPRPAIPPGFAKVVQQKQTTTKAPFTSETRMEGDILERVDNMNKTSLPNESTTVPEVILSDDASKVDEKVVAVSRGFVNGQAGVDLPVARTLSESLVGASSTEALNHVSERQHLGAKATTEDGGSEWNIKLEGIVDDKKQGILSGEIKENIFVGIEEYSQGQESLLDKWFGRSKSGKGSSTDGCLPSHPLADESQNIPQKEESWPEDDSRMSKFAQWFHPEENHFIEGPAVSSDILSLFPNGGVKPSSSLSKEHSVQEASQRVSSGNSSRNHGRVLPMPSGPSLEDIEKGLTANANVTSGHEQSVAKGSAFLRTLSLKTLEMEPKNGALSGIFGEHSPVGKFKFQSVAPPAHTGRSSPVFLTCEDIEQSMLAEAGTTVERITSKAAQPSRTGGMPSRKDRHAGGQAGDSAASRHLLSLLQKGAGAGRQSFQGGLSSHMESLATPTKAEMDELWTMGSDDWRHSSRAQEVNVSGKTPANETPTLEALFGKAFMSELRSVEAPLSANSFASDLHGNLDGTQPLSDVYPISRQLSKASTAAPHTNFSKQWPGTIGPSSRAGWTETSVVEANRHGHLMDAPVSRSKPNHVANDNEDSQPISAGQGLWGNGVNVSSHVSDGSLHSITTNVGNNGSFVSSVESASLAVGDATDSSVTGLRRVRSSDLDTRINSKVNGDGRGLPSLNFMAGQERVSEDGTLALNPGKVLSNDEPISGPSTSFDSSGISQVSMEDGLSKRLVGDATTVKFAPSELSAILREEATIGVSQDIESFHLASRKLDRREIIEDVGGEKVVLGNDVNSGNDRKFTDALSDTVGFIGKAKDGNGRASTLSTGGLPEQVNAVLGRAGSGSSRFKANVGGLQPTSGFSAFQPVPPPLQHQQTIGPVYRSETSTSISLQQRQNSIPVHHHLQQNPSSGTLSMFPPQQFHPQPVVPQQQQQQQLLARSFNSGSPLEFPHVAFGHAPTSAQNRPLPTGHLHFPPSPHGHLSPPGAYHPMGHMGPVPNHFLPPGQIPQRGPVMSPMAEAHMFMQEQSLHDMHGLGSKAGPQGGPSLFPLGGHALQSGQGLMFHQPLPHNLRGQQNQILPAHGPWVVPYPADFMRTASKSHELAGYPNGTGLGVGAANSLDRWFGMELSRNVSGIPVPGIVQHSSHGLDSESKMRFS